MWRRSQLLIVQRGTEDRWKETPLTRESWGSIIVCRYSIFVTVITLTDGEREIGLEKKGSQNWRTHCGQKQRRLGCCPKGDCSKNGLCLRRLFLYYFILLDEQSQRRLRVYFISFFLLKKKFPGTLPAKTVQSFLWRDRFKRFGLSTKENTISN